MTASRAVSREQEVRHCLHHLFSAASTKEDMERTQKYSNPTTETELSCLTDGLQIRGWPRVA